MKAIIIADKYDNKQVKTDLYTYINSHGILDILEFENLDELSKAIDDLPNSEYIIFLNIYYRFTNLNLLTDMLKKNKFRRLSIGNYIFYFNKVDNRIKVSRDSLFVQDIDSKIDYFFKVQNQSAFYIKPIIDELPRIFLYTYNRAVYLRLTLNSLMDSLKNCPEVPVTVILNKPTADVIAVALEFAYKYDQIDVLQLDKNVAFAGLNVGIQWYRPKYIVIAEDDFILPSSVKYTYPVWPYQFVDRLKHFDVVGWRCNFDNIPFESLLEWKDYNYKTHIGWHNTRELFSIPMMAQLTCVKTKLWMDHCNPRAKVAFDVDLVRNSNGISTPYLRGYHTGFNQEMDNYYFDKTNAFNIDDIAKIVKAKNLRTKEERVINLDDIFKK